MPPIPEPLREFASGVTDLRSIGSNLTSAVIVALVAILSRMRARRYPRSRIARELIRADIWIGVALGIVMTRGPMRDKLALAPWYATILYVAGFGCIGWLAGRLGDRSVVRFDALAVGTRRELPKASEVSTNQIESDRAVKTVGERAESESGAPAQLEISISREMTDQAFVKWAEESRNRFQAPINAIVNVAGRLGARDKVRAETNNFNIASNDLVRVLKNPLYVEWVEDRFVGLYESYRELVVRVYGIAAEREGQINLVNTQEHVDWCVADTTLAENILDTAPARIAGRLEAIGRTNEFHLR